MRFRYLFLLVPLVAHPAPAAAQNIPGFSPASAARELQLEKRLQAIPDTVTAQQWTRVLAAKPHVAGTPAQRETADYVLRQMASWGLDTQRVAFKVYMPYPDSTIVERITPTRMRLTLEEPPIPGDPTTIQKPWPAMNGNSGKGDVTAPLVYVNQGLPTDYQLLDSLGISVRGKIAIARYGGSFRGIKAREAEAHGAVGLLIYSDPKDDGFVVGAVYPDGPMRNPQEVQRGSIFNGDGDPTTPDWPSTENAKRLREDSLPVSHIPVVPIGYGNAELLMKEMHGASVPSAWQGGMKFDYHFGDGTVQARVAVWPERGQRAYKMIYDTFGRIRGSDFPNEMIVIGGHRDAWGPGADDNVSGTVSVMAAARAWATAASEGMRPRRTLVFATWDAEEWGLVGSTEWVQLMRDSLKATAVAYYNQDESAAGRSFGAGGTASLHGMLRDATKVVQMPGDTTSIYARWASGGRGPAQQAGNGRGRRNGRGNGNGPVVAPVFPEPRIGDLGGGSDFAGFYNNLGIPSIETGFGGRAGWYHSAYDTYTAMEKFGDPGYLSHAAEGRLAAVIVARLANADVIPYDFAALGAYLGVLAAPAGPGARIREANLPRIAAELAPLAAATNELKVAGERFNALRDTLLGRGTLANGTLARVNKELRQVEQQLTRQSGLVGRPFMKNLIFASDRDNGYANVALPGISEALRDNDLERAKRETKDLTGRVRAAAAQVDAAAKALGKR